MKYIIMCGGVYREWETPRQLYWIHGERIVERTIRLLHDAGVRDIAISSNNEAFSGLGVVVLKHENGYYARRRNDVSGDWCDGFYPYDEPVCYLFGDVIFSPTAIRKIVNTETDDIELFGSAEPFAPEYPKKWVEPFGFKVVNVKHFRQAIATLKEIGNTCWRSPIAWDLWNVIKGRRIDIDDYRVDYTVINDYTCDIDHKSDLRGLINKIPLGD